MDKQRALTRAYKRHHQAIYRYCLTIVGNPDDAQEALQNTMVKALRALQGERRDIQLKPWLYRIAHNESIELLRKRREVTEMDEETASAGAGLAETAAQRERLRRLLADLGELPERQRAALVMRELGGLGFEEIGEAFDTSKAVVRQTVYEARLALRELEAGREMNCEEVMHRLSNADGRTMRRRDLRAHLRSCPDCRAFREAIGERQRDLAALAPLPAAASAATLHAALGGGQGGAGGVAAGSLGAGAGKAVATSAALKSVATVATVAVVGVGVADREGLVDLGLRGSAEHPADARPAGYTETAAGGSAESPPAHGRASANAGDGKATGSSPASADGSTPGNTDGSPPGAMAPGGSGEALTTDHSPPAADPASGELPAASDRGQGTAAAHGGGRAAAPTHSPSHSRAPEHAKAPTSPPSPSQGAKPDKPAKPEQPSSLQPPAKAPDAPSGQGKGPDNSAEPPSQPSEGSPDRGGSSNNTPGGGPKDAGPA